VSENLDLVRSIFAAWERGDWTSIEWADPEIELVYADGIEAGPPVGSAEMAASWARFLSGWEGLRLRAEEYRELADGRVLAWVRLSGRGKASGLDLEEPGLAIFQASHGKVKQLVYYNHRDRALADLGLEE
jgi:hypothetical protein